MKTNNLLLCAIILIVSHSYGQDEYYADYSLKGPNIKGKLALLKAEKQQKFTTKKALTEARKAEIKEQRQSEIQQILEERANTAVLKKERKEERLLTKTQNLSEKIDFKNQIKSKNIEKIADFNQQKKAEYARKDLQRFYNKKLVNNRLKTKKEQIQAKKERRLAQHLTIKEIISSKVLLRRALFKEKVLLSSLRISTIKIQKELAIRNRIKRKDEIKLARQREKNNNYKYKELKKVKFHGSVTKLGDE